jgi:hypothetical protein
MDSQVNSSDFVCNFSVMCSFPCKCWITLTFLINLQTYKKSGAAYCQLFCSKSLYFTECAIKIVQVTTKTSFITEFLENILLIFY